MSENSEKNVFIFLFMFDNYAKIKNIQFNVK